MADSSMLITDCHVHIENLDQFKPSAMELFQRHRSQFDEILIRRAGTVGAPQFRKKFKRTGKGIIVGGFGRDRR